MTHQHSALIEHILSTNFGKRRRQNLFALVWKKIGRGIEPTNGTCGFCCQYDAKIQKPNLNRSTAQAKTIVMRRSQPYPD